MFLFQKNDYPVPCKNMLVSVGGKNSEKNKDKDLATAFFYFAPRAVLSEENYLYDVDTLLAEVGGYVGLLLGFSFAHLLQWFNFLFDKILTPESG